MPTELVRGSGFESLRFLDISYNYIEKEADLLALVSDDAVA